MPLTVVDQGLLSSTAQYTGFKNRIINGAMVIDQRNNGSAVTVTNAASSFYGVDRFFANRANGYALSTSTVQQVSDAPAGFVRSIRYTNSTAETPTGTMYSNLQQYIEGFNIADLNWGTSNAKTVTLSFWVKISITGTFGGALRSGSADASYPFSFSYSSANTWQFVSITIPGPTIGTFSTTNGVGFSVNWELGVGSSLTGSATGAWQAINALGLTGGTKLNATAGATYQLTGCQLEVGSTATSFDYRPYGTELALCQRYAYPIRSGLSGFGNGTTVADVAVTFPVEMRSVPSVTQGTLLYTAYGATSAYTQSSNLNSLPTSYTQNGCTLRFSNFTGLTANSAYIVVPNATTSVVTTYACILTSEL